MWNLKVILFRAKDMSAQDAFKGFYFVVHLHNHKGYLYHSSDHNTPKVQLRAKISCYISCLVSILN